MSDANAPQLNWSQLTSLASDDVQQQIVDFIVEARNTRGENWLPEIQAEFPLARWIADLVANYTADEAIEQIAEAYPLVPVNFLAGDAIRSLHGRLKFELEKPR